MPENIPCPHCGSHSTYVTSIGHAWLQSADAMLVCNKCGHRIYGIERVRELQAKAMAEQQEAARQRLEFDQKLRAARDAERKREREEAEALARLKCAWPPCHNDHTTSSKYCSRTCNDKNAHAREKARKEAKTATAPG